MGEKIVELVGPLDLLVVAADAAVEQLGPDVVRVSRPGEALTFDLADEVYGAGPAARFAQQLRVEASRG